MWSVPFFVALQRACAIFGHVRRTGTYSPATLGSLRTIKRCAIALLGFVGGGVAFILRFGDPEDRPAGLFMSLLVAFAAGGIATAAARFHRKLQDALRRADVGRN